MFRRFDADAALAQARQYGLRYNKHQVKELRRRAAVTPATAAEIAAFEASTGLALPADYAEFLRTWNGGVPEHSTFRVGDRSFVIREFVPLAGDARDTWGLVGHLELFADGIPEGTLPVASSPGGDLYLVDSASGHVSFWDHETEELTPVAASFRGLVDALRSDDTA